VNITGEISSGAEVEIDIDLDDIVSEIDFASAISENIDIDGRVEIMLGQYHGNNSPCSVGRAFEQAVWWAMSRQAVHDGNYTSLPGLGVREELKAIINAL
tara:strand:- start:469 stop:768 length:300 start_codon:yes stop_codon:yes gene_type:complete